MKHHEPHPFSPYAGLGLTPVRVSRPGFLARFFAAWGHPLVVGFLLGFVVALLAGCNAPGDYYGTKPEVAAANAKPGGFGGLTATAPAIVAGAVKSYGLLTGFGGVLLAAGAFVLSQRDLSNGLGFGLLAAGLSLLLAGTLLPVYGGWIGLGLLGALGAYYWQRTRTPDAVTAPTPSLTDRIKSLTT